MMIGFKSRAARQQQEDLQTIKDLQNHKSINSFIKANKNTADLASIQDSQQFLPNNNGALKVPKYLQTTEKDMLVKYLRGALGDKKKKLHLNNPVDVSLIASPPPENHNLSESEQLQ